MANIGYKEFPTKIVREDGSSLKATPVSAI